MGFLEFIGIVLVVVIIAAFGVWILTLLGRPNPPNDLAVKVIYAIAGLIIIVTLLRALGLGHDVQIPKVF